MRTDKIIGRQGTGWICCQLIRPTLPFMINDLNLGVDVRMLSTPVREYVRNEVDPHLFRIKTMHIIDVIV